MRKIFVFILFLAIFLFGCIGSETQSHFEENESTSITAEISQGSVKQLSIGERVEIDNISFIADKWGISPSWEISLPEGAVYLWIHVNATNVGSTPIKYMPDNFWVEYRGTSAKSKLAELGAYDLPIPSAWGPIRKKTDYYPGTSNIGYILFPVPKDIGDDEAVFRGVIGSSNISIPLSNPIRYTGDRILIKNLTVGNCAHYGGGHYQCTITLIFQNAYDTPTVNKPSLSINGTPLSGGFTVYPWMGPFEERTNDWYLDAYEKGDKWIYYVKVKNTITSVRIGEAGENAELSICPHCSVQSMEITLPEVG